jgi:hypothetical protein
MGVENPDPSLEPFIEVQLPNLRRVNRASWRDIFKTQLSAHRTGRCVSL